MEAASVPDFLSKCLRNPLLDKKDMAVFYRGVNKIIKENPHIPSLYYPPNRFYEHEHTIFEEFVSVFPDELLAQKTTVERLFVMQHYRFPTRLLDISRNPLVDLFFACFADKGDEASCAKDGIVYVYALPSQEIKYTGSDTVSILASLCKCKSYFSIEDEPGQLLYLIREEKPGFSEKAYTESGIKEINSVVCLRPRLNNPRIIRQDGYFFLFGIDRIRGKPAKMPPEWIKEPIIIPAQCKKRIQAL